MTRRPLITVPLLITSSGEQVKIGQADLTDDSIIWTFEGPQGEQILRMVRDHLAEVARTGGAQIFDLSVPVQPYTEGWLSDVTPFKITE